MFLLLAVVLFRSREHENCGPQPGCVRAHIESKMQFSLDPPSSKVQESGIDPHPQWRLMPSTCYGIGLCIWPLSSVLLLVF